MQHSVKAWLTLYMIVLRNDTHRHFLALPRLKVNPGKWIFIQWPESSVFRTDQKPEISGIWERRIGLVSAGLACVLLYCQLCGSMWAHTDSGILQYSVYGTGEDELWIRLEIWRDFAIFMIECYGNASASGCCCSPVFMLSTEHSCNPDCIPGTTEQNTIATTGGRQFLYKNYCKYTKPVHCIG